MRPFLGGLIVFGTSAAVLALEILAVRLLAPYLGITIEVTTGVIGTVLAGIALGTWLGGRLADRMDPRRLLGPILIAGGVLALTVVPMVTLASRLGVGAGPEGILIYAGLAFFLPAAVLSAASPTVVKLQLHHLGQTGAVVGSYSAIGTTGAIFGSFLTGFVLVAALPTRPIVIAIGVALIVAGALTAWQLGRARPAQMVALAAALALAGIAWSVLTPTACQRESAYFCISVEAASDDGTERVLRMDTLRHAYVDLDDPTLLEFRYTRLLGDIADGVAPSGSSINALHVGGGGFTLPRYIEATRPGSEHRILELDPVVLEVATEELGFETSEKMEVVIGDGRLAIAEEPDDRYDLVIGDAFGGVAVPWHLTTTEFLSQVRRTLRPGGDLCRQHHRPPAARACACPAGHLRRSLRARRGLRPLVARRWRTRRQRHPPCLRSAPPPGRHPARQRNPWRPRRARRRRLQHRRVQRRCSHPARRLRTHGPAADALPILTGPEGYVAHTAGMENTRKVRTRPELTRVFVLMLVVALLGVSALAVPVAAQDDSPDPSASPAAAEAACQSASDLEIILGFVRDSVEAESGLVPVGIGVIAALSEARTLVGLVGETYRPLVQDLTVSLQDLRATIGDLDDLDTAGAKLAAVGETVVDIGNAMDAVSMQLRTGCPEE